MERELAYGALPRCHRMDRRERAGRGLPAGDEAVGRQIPRRGLLRRWAMHRHTTAMAGGTEWPCSAGSDWRTWPAGFGTPEDAQGCRIVAATCGGMRVHSVYVPNGRSLDSEHYAFKLEWLARIAPCWTRPPSRGSRWRYAGHRRGPRRRRRVGSDAARRHDPRERTGAGQLAGRSRHGGSRTSSGGSTTPGCSAGGTTGPAIFTRGAGCGSTSCC